jgi:parallel beta-helix repeat protein
VNGVDVVVDDFHIEGLNIINAKKDGLRIEDSDGIIIRAVKVEWTNGPDSSNGAYGIYPVRVQHVLMEDSEAIAASDAGIYVGQCQHAIIRNNRATQNVAGMEIENTQFADVYGNHAEDNTAGIVAFDLPGNPIVGRDVQIHDNVIINNNHENFAPGGTVAVIPAGTGTFVMASRRVEVFGNTYANNNTVDIALLSGFVVESDPAQWAIPLTDLEGDVTGLELDGDGSTFVANFRSRDVYVHDNTHEGSGDRPDAASFDRELGILLAAVYGDTPIDTVLYDSIIETSFDPVDPAGNSNDNGMCVAATAGVTFGSLNLDDLANAPVLANVYRPAAPFAPFDCTGPAITPPSGVAGQ